MRPRPSALWRHEVRRAGWVALLPPPLAAVILVGAAADGALRLGQPTRGTALILQSLLEVALPLAAGVGAASLVGRDPAVELHLTFATAYRSTILRRVPTRKVTSQVMPIRLRPSRPLRRRCCHWP